MGREETTFDVFDEAKRLFPCAPQFCGIVRNAIIMARKMGFRSVGIEHLLACLSDVPKFSQIIEACGGDPRIMVAALERGFHAHARLNRKRYHFDEMSIDETISRIASGLSARDSINPDPDEFEECAISLSLREITGSAMAEAAIVECGAAQVLELSDVVTSLDEDMQNSSSVNPRAGLTEEEFDELLAAASHPPEEVGDIDNTAEEDRRRLERLLSPRKGGEEADLFQRGMLKPDDGPSEPSKASKPAEKKGPVSKLFKEANEEDAREVDSALRNLKEDALNGRLPEIFGRDQEVDRIVSSLRRWRKGSIVIVGEPGTGKSALAEGLAHRFASGDLPKEILKRPFYELSLTGLMSNTRYRGEFEGRIRTFLKRVTEERAIIFVDEIHMLMSVGSTNLKSGGFDAANLLKPALARGDIAIIGATTPTELRVLRQDEAMMRRFEVMHLKEPDRQETLNILTGGAALGCLSHHNVSIGAGVAERICEITDLYQPERRFPDKAFDLLDMSCLSASNAGCEVVELCHVDMGAKLLRLHVPRLPDQDTIRRLEALPLKLEKSVPGQKEAITDLRDRIMSNALMARKSGPKGAFLLAGRAGAGKAAAANGVANVLRLPVIQIDMSETGPEGGRAHLLGMKGHFFDEMPGLLTQALETHRDIALILHGLDGLDRDGEEAISTMLDEGIVRSGQGHHLSLRGSVVFALVDRGKTQIDGRPGFHLSGDAGSVHALDGLMPPRILSTLGRPVWFEDPKSASISSASNAFIEEILDQIGANGVHVSIHVETREALLAQCAGAADIRHALEDMIMPTLVRYFVLNPNSRSVRLEMLEDKVLCMAV